ncbi:hypothetical protein [Paenibacillus odorifer]|uniref:Restriction endonuclease n=1 Tax=Paenibacillus odorifer TaxID=189426 RepID=A0ABX3GEI8_9BACL|nr:hypothetical protein [Paenibacillus odorifer]OMD05141.1 hypothetical protein BSO21_31640 [Paenibacillus odorifer]
MYSDRIKEIVDLSYHLLTRKIVNKSIHIDNEATFQLELAYILKSVGQLYQFGLDEKFSLQLETYLPLSSISKKSNSNRARIDILLKFGDSTTSTTCAIELKFFKKANHREPNNRYDVFKDLSNLEMYRDVGIDLCYFMIGTDHSHYVNQPQFSLDTAAFDFRDGSSYHADTELVYDTAIPYGLPISLKNSYLFKWDIFEEEQQFFLKIPV